MARFRPNNGKEAEVLFMVLRVAPVRLPILLLGAPPLPLDSGRIPTMEFYRRGTTGASG